ncbi:MAG: hypothetical protein Q7J34_02675 [Bacteroidales bacterium]|nr:hypothetical protein [Bacteroidales bacterium]
MNTIINELLVFASVSKEEVTKTSIEMQPVINESIRRLSFLIQSRNANGTVADDLLPSMGNAHWIEEVWYNYLSNAVKMEEISRKYLLDLKKYL